MYTKLLMAQEEYKSSDFDFKKFCSQIIGTTVQFFQNFKHTISKHFFCKTRQPHQQATLKKKKTFIVIFANAALEEFNLIYNSQRQMNEGSQNIQK